MTLLEYEHREQLRGTVHPGSTGRVAEPVRPLGLWPRRLWLAGLGAAAAWALLGALLADREILNPGGWTIVGDFLSAALHPELATDFLVTVRSAAAVTVAYATVGTALALVIGLLGGLLSSEVLWLPDPLAEPRRRLPLGRWVVRAAAASTRGVHEAVWALLLVSVLGRDPWVAVLAIGVPFGAVTAKVVAELLDDVPREPVVALRAAGAGRLPSVIYGIGPTVLPDVISYACYRFECALRSSVVLGVIGAGGIGFELLQSFQSLRYEEIWTLIYALCALALIADRGSVALRRRTRRHRAGLRLGLVAIAVAVAVRQLDLQPGSLLAARARRLLGDLASRSLPPRLPPGGSAQLWGAVVDTVQMSLIAITIAVVLATPSAFVAARAGGGRQVTRVPGRAVRAGLLLLRTVPPVLWAFLVLLVVFPGPLPGGIALGLYSAGVLGRLNAEAVENADPAPRRALRTAGAGSVAAFAYGTVPVVAPRFASLALYRWEVVVRETVVVGLVGAGGLGRLLAQQNAALDEPRMLTTIATLIAVALAVDTVSGHVRAALR